MNLLQFVPIKLTTFLVIGIIIGYYSDVSIWISVAIVVVGLIMLYTIHFRHAQSPGAAFGFWTMISCIGIGWFSVSIHSSFNYTQQLRPNTLDKARLWTLSIREEMKPTNYYQRYMAHVVRINARSSSGLVLCRFPKTSTIQLSAGDQLVFWGSASEIDPPRNPYQFNYKKFMNDQGVYLQLKVQPDDFIKLNKSSGRPIDIAQNLRKKIMDQLELQPFGKDELAVIKAILLGYRHDVDKSLSNNYKAAGAMHIMAISGLHIGVILAIINFVLRPMKRLPNDQLVKLVISVLILWSFALLAGFSASILRAVAMFTFLAYAMYLNRPGSTYNILALSIFFILLIIDPLMLFQVGFQLSYAAVLSIVWLYPKLMGIWNPEQLMLRRIWQLFCVGVAAQLGVLPLSLFYFHQFPALFFISNLIIVPFLGLIIAGGLLLIILVMIDIVPTLLISLYNQMITSMNKVVEWVASQEAFLFQEIYFDKMHLILSICLIISFIVVVENFRFRNIIVFLCMIIGLQLWDGYTILASKSKEQIILLHTTGTSSLLHQKGNMLQVYSDRPDQALYAIKGLKTAERIKRISMGTLGNSYSINNKQWLIIDDPAIDKEIVKKADTWLLSDSPKINLDRLLSLHKPKKVIADGSNYHSFVDRWRQSCMKYKIPFYSTSESGALTISEH